MKNIKKKKKKKRTIFFFAADYVKIIDLHIVHTT